MIYHTIEQLIGDTPLLKLDVARYGIKHIDVYVKLEYLNPFGSIKDRTVMGLLEDVDLDAARANGTSLVESSSGNTARAMQVIASRKGVGFTSVTNRIRVPETEKQLQYLGVNIKVVPGQSECPDPNDSNNALAVIERMLTSDPGAYIHRDQYTNDASRAYHERTTATELFTDLPTIDHYVTGVGAGGSSGGVISYAKKHGKSTRFTGVIADPHDFIPGIRTRNELHETSLFCQDDFAELIEVTTGQALDALQLLVKDQGVLAGPTTGANFSVALQLAQKLDDTYNEAKRGTMVFIACDRLDGYMSYIQKRRPEVFNVHTNADVFATHDDSTVPEKPASQETWEWTHREKVCVIDIRGLPSYELFHIPGSVSYPEAELKELLMTGTPFPDAPVLVVCARGERSKMIAAILQHRGIEAYSLAGGIGLWRTNNLLIEEEFLNCPALTQDG